MLDLFIRPNIEDEGNPFTNSKTWDTLDRCRRKLSLGGSLPPNVSMLFEARPAVFYLVNTGRRIDGAALRWN